jgi:outer membrane protein
MTCQAFKSFALSTVMLLAGFGGAEVAQAETLTEALISVYNKNPRLLAERARLREVDENYIQARAQGRFTVNASGQYSRTVLSGEGDFIQSGPAPGPGEAADLTFFYGPRSGQVQVIQPLYQGGRVKALKSQAKSGILAQREVLRATENQLFLSAANAYLDVQLAEEAARIRRSNVRVLSRQLDAANARFEVGEGTRTDIAQSQSRVALAEAGLAQADADLQTARSVYERIVGRMPMDLQPTPAFALPPTLQDAIRLARTNNPELIASYYSEEAGKAAIDVAKAAGKPVISLNGTVAEQRGELFSFDRAQTASLTAQISIPIFSGGLNSSRVRQAKHAKTRLAFESRDRELAVDQAIKQIWAQKEAAQQSLMASRKQVEAAEIAFEGVTLEQEVGTRTQLDVLDAEQELLNAKLSVISAERNVNATTFQLLATIGVFDSQGINLPVQTPYDPNKNFEAVKYDGLTAFSDRAIADPIEGAADGLSDAVSSGIETVETIFSNPPVSTAAQLPVEGITTVFSAGKTAIETSLGQEPDISPLAGETKPEIETDPYQTEGTRDLPTLKNASQADSPQN